MLFKQGCRKAEWYEERITAAGFLQPAVQEIMGCFREYNSRFREIQAIYREYEGGVREYGAEGIF
ncbi:hypothetical protein LRR81_03535 [Metabacillus sp. GX 13764]|uniref:hypothetical protein n=1 Tax=Metabacillus kandeliae TaxID=2900151 RepID=UPI001E5AFBFA|nr:hypothetical protein [Metabacillus kandeliae]MCD7033289.1 hypothetical protein [Metabacillus kandeliae]